MFFLTQNASSQWCFHRVLKGAACLNQGWVLGTAALWALCWESQLYGPCALVHGLLLSGSGAAETRPLESRVREREREARQGRQTLAQSLGNAHADSH